MVFWMRAAVFELLSGRLRVGSSSIMQCCFCISGVSSSHLCWIRNWILDKFRLCFGGFAGMHRNQVLPIHFDGSVEARGSFWTIFRSLAGHTFFISAIPFCIAGVSPGQFWLDQPLIFGHAPAEFRRICRKYTETIHFK